jgi:hypothetical protein
MALKGFPMIFIIPFVLGAMAVLTGGAGILAGLDGMANEEQAREIAEDAQARHEYACNAIEELREATQDLAAQYGELQIAVQQNTIGRFIDLIEQIGLTGSDRDRAFLQSFEGTKSQKFREYQSVTTNGTSTTWGKIIADMLVGEATNHLVKFGAKGGTLALVGLFGHASTGTAISGLSGAAANSAALAWLGGGSLATGGGGMAVGSLVLGGITLAPVLLVGGFMMGAKGDKALTRAIEYQEEVNIEIDQIIEVENFLLKVQERICDLYNLVNELDDKAIDILNQLESKSFDLDRDAAKFQRLTFLLRAVVEIMKAPVLNNNGKLNPGTKILVVKYNNFQG